MYPGFYKGFKDISLVDMREFIGRARRSAISLEEVAEIERHPLPGAASCAMLGTANTMSFLAEGLGLSVPGYGTLHAQDTVKESIAHEPGKRLMPLIKEGTTPRQIVRLPSVMNGIAPDMGPQRFRQFSPSPHGDRLVGRNGDSAGAVR